MSSVAYVVFDLKGVCVKVSTFALENGMDDAVKTLERSLMVRSDILLLSILLYISSVMTVRAVSVDNLGRKPC